MSYFWVILVLFAGCIAAGVVNELDWGYGSIWTIGAWSGVAMTKIFDHYDHKKVSHD